jgi:hypothetical protein
LEGACSKRDLEKRNPVFHSAFLLILAPLLPFGFQNWIFSQALRSWRNPKTCVPLVLCPRTLNNPLPGATLPSRRRLAALNLEEPVVLDFGARAQ